MPTHLAVFALLAACCAGQDPVAKPTSNPQPVQTIGSPGAWDFPGGATLEVTSRFFHGADMLTRATIHWPQTDSRKACHHTVDVAADSFGNRQRWRIAFSPDEPVLWVASARTGHVVNGKPVIERIQRVDLRKPDAIQCKSAFGAGPVRFLPQRIDDALSPHMLVPAANQHALDEQVAAAIQDDVIEVLYHALLVAKDGRPLAGVPVRFPVLLARKPHPEGMKSPPPQALHAPSNSGLDIVHAVSAADGYVTALIPITRRARDAGAFVRPTITSFPGETTPPITRSAARKLVPWHMSKDAVRMRMSRVEDAGSQGLITGTVFDSAGRAIRGCTVSVGVRDPVSATIDPPLARTDKQGTFAIRGLSCAHPLRLTIRHGKQCTSLTTLVKPALAAETAQPRLELELGVAPDQKTPTLRLRHQ